MVRSGGVAGRVLRWEVDLDAVAGETADELRALLDQAPAWQDGAAALPDGLRWRVLSEGPGLDVAFGDPGPEPAQRLVDLVRRGVAPPT